MSLPFSAIAANLPGDQTNVKVRLGNEVAVLVGCVDLNSEERLDCLRLSAMSPRSYNEFFCCRNVSAWDLARADFENGVISLPVADAAWSGLVSYIPPPRKYCLLEQGRMIQNCI